MKESIKETSIINSSINTMIEYLRNIKLNKTKLNDLLTYNCYCYLDSKKSGELAWPPIMTNFYLL